MPERSSYAHGIPSWVDLSSPDPEASAAFYGALFGWEHVAPETLKRPAATGCSRCAASSWRASGR